MNLTIPELARAVGQSENFVRQHIHRGHLPVQKAGRRVSVAVDEALHWARSRDLPLVLPHSVRPTARDSTDRVARITVLAWQEDGAPTRNLFTLVRLRARHTLGPWAPETQGTWSCEPAENDLRLFWVDVPAAQAREAVDEMVNSGVLAVGDTEVHYALQPAPRRYGAYRDERGGSEAGICSPFRRHSSRMTEYWSPEDELGDRWYELLGDPLSRLKPLVERLGFGLDDFPDRVGNAVVADAQDALVCSLSADRGNTLRFTAQSATPLQGLFRATIWARHCQDDILRLEVPVIEGSRVIPVSSDVDEIGFSVYDLADGRCVDRMAFYLIKDVVVNLGIGTGTTLDLKDRGPRRIRHSHSPASHSQLRIDLDQDENGPDAWVRQRSLRRRSFQRQASARRERRLARFGPDEFPGATDYFVERLASFADARKAIYIADPYFMKAHTTSDIIKFYLKILTTTSGRPLNVLCGSVSDSALPPWWTSLPKTMTRHLRVRSFCVPESEGRTFFHDRYVITPDREISVTNSFNGWERTGVTLIENAFGVYRAEAEYLWALPEGSTGGSVLVREIYDGRSSG